MWAWICMSPLFNVQTLIRFNTLDFPCSVSIFQATNFPQDIFINLVAFFRFGIACFTLAYAFRSLEIPNLFCEDFSVNCVNPQIDNLAIVFVGNNVERFSKRLSDFDYFFYVFSLRDYYYLCVFMHSIILTFI